MINNNNNKNLCLLQHKDNSSNNNNVENNNGFLLPSQDYNNNICLFGNNDNNDVCTNNIIEEKDIITYEEDNVENIISNKAWNVVKESASDSSEFLIETSDTILTLGFNNSSYKYNINNLISKIIIVGEPYFVNLSTMSEALAIMRIKELNLISVDLNNNESNTIQVTITNKGAKIVYMKMTREFFIYYLSIEGNFLNYNKNSLYIIRGGTYLDIKNLFTIIESQEFNIGRGGSQKSHALSPLDLRLSCYLMAMFNFNHRLISSLNTFNYMNKDRYLSYINIFCKSIYKKG